MTYSQLQEKTNLSPSQICKWCKENDVTPLPKRYEIYIQRSTHRKLDIVAGIKKPENKTHGEWQKILGFHKGKTPRQSCQQFLKKHKIPFKLSEKNQLAKKRIDKMNEIGILKLNTMTASEIGEVLEFKIIDGYYQNLYPFLKKHKIGYTKE